ncbi:hypothetical protein DFH07DRAFT_838326 [Mycena maculata]|uniref:Uncharacterized protein n=1 Tax=Mycena maculata TaxID=230809 RepID=A0AAD7IEF0_9AGAR|nr:hypothetical protein DFH07DRAFT_838326 [Mycena maculata]
MGDDVEPAARPGLALLDEFSDLRNIDDAARALKLIVDAYSSDPDSQLDGRYTSQDCCLRLLRFEATLHEQLKEAHETKAYEKIANSDLLRKPPGLPRAAQKLLEELRSKLEQFIDSKRPLQSWSPNPEPSDSNILGHLASLKILTLEERGPPMVILNDLGSFAGDPLLKLRIENIFMRGKRTLLVNTSGSGKTKLLFEGLCHEWGLYFTSRQDASHLGSYDLHRILNTTLTMDKHFSKKPDGDDKKLTYNRLQTYRRISEALLARLLIFHMFLEITTKRGRAEEHKITWLLLQLDCVLGGHLDIFDDLTRALVEPKSVYTWARISDTLCDIHSILQPDSHIFLVLDEAQAAAEKFPEAFHADPGANPILLEILKTWDSHSPEASVVVAGTEIASKIFADDKNIESLRWTSDTGAFDEQTAQENYLRRFLPPSYLTSKSGEEFLRRVWQWVRGRHRYTASLIESLLAASFEKPHELLDQYIQTLTEFIPTDNREVTAKQPLTNFGLLDDLNPSHYSALESESNRQTKFDIHDTLFNYLTAGPRSVPFGADRIDLVSLDYGRFIDGEMREIFVDEPIVLAGAAMWMSQPTSEVAGTSHQPAGAASLSRFWDRPGTAKTFAKSLTFYFSHALRSKPLLSELFTFPKPIVAWAKQAVELVELHAGQGGQVRYSVISEPDISGPLATSAQTLDELASWMGHKDRTPFCLPVATNPDLLFVLKLADGSFVWVVLQATPNPSDGSELLECLEEDKLFCDEEHDPEHSAHKRAMELLNSPPTGSHATKSDSPTVLRVVASFEDQIVLKKRGTMAEPHASVSMEMFRKFIAELPPSEIVASIVDSVLGKRKEPPAKGKGKGRAKKRQNSLPVAVIEGDSKAEKGKKTRATTPEPSTRVLRQRPPKDAPADNKGKGKAKAKQG